jgi:adenylate cyclase
LSLRFRTAQIIALVTVLLITVAVVGISSYRNSTFALRELSSQILEQTSQRIDQHITTILDVAVSQSTTYEDLMNNGALDPNDYVGMTQAFLGSLRANRHLSYLSFGTERGEYWHVQRRKDGDILVQYLLDEGGRVVLTDHRPLPGGELEEVFRDEQTTRDPRVRPYYHAGKEAGRQTWTETYIFFAQAGLLDIPGVTRATPIYRDGALVGVMTADFDLAALSQFLRELQVGSSGFAFILELRKDGSRRVIAHPDDSLLTRPVDAADPGAGREGINADEFADSRVRAFDERLAGDLRAAPTEALTLVDLALDGTEYLGGYRKLSGHELDWIIGMMMPRSDVMGSVYANTRTTVITVLAGIVIAILLALWLSAAIASTLRELAEDSESIGRFELESKEPKQSYLVEVRQLAVALEEMKTGLRSFKKFVPAELVRGLLASGEEARLGGQRREISIYFSDLAGFTSIAEKMPADELVELLGQYLGEMTDQILSMGGTVDKYIGDAIMAFWGAPKAREDHPLVACQAALANQQRLRALRAAWAERDWPKLRQRIGIHTGEAVVGNFGSESRLDYTAIGDSVNLASRLEGLNSHYGTEIMLSETTYAAVADDVVARPLDRVKVKGRGAGILVYELVGLRGEVDRAVVDRVRRYTEALDLYFARDWRRAEDIFLEVAEKYEDVAAGRMLARVRGYAETPPPERWDGIHRMTSK